jgi:hypothetical protein
VAFEPALPHETEKAPTLVIVEDATAEWEVPAILKSLWVVIAPVECWRVAPSNKTQGASALAVNAVSLDDVTRKRFVAAVPEVVGAKLVLVEANVTLVAPDGWIRTVPLAPPLSWRLAEPLEANVMVVLVSAPVAANVTLAVPPVIVTPLSEEAVLQFTIKAELATVEVGPTENAVKLVETIPSAAVFELNVRLALDLGPKSPVAAVANRGKQVVSVASLATVTLVAVVAVVALPVKAPINVVVERAFVVAL